jgi:lipopolysaccharide/colanic/teichoic acid biosynthesis glycosyltransferase
MIIKFLFDRIVAFLSLLFLMPIFLFVTILIMIKMPGVPVIFKQKRVGQNGILFHIYKFRTMNAEHSGSTISIAGESRITSLGAILRKYKLDELPELWNVLIGNMSFVGPRPDVPGYADRLQGDNRKVLKLKPGITGPASLKYINEEELLAAVNNPKEYNDNIIFPDKVRINLLYQINWSILLDIKIIWHTIIRKKYDENKYFKNEK